MRAVNESRSGSFQARKFYHAQGIDTNLTPQHMPDYKRNRETFLSLICKVAYSIHMEARRS